ncbi:c-type cytochrome biogenesis protein CcmI [Tardiphaga sp. vice154]|uniref:c-type cytochrome biogenesis protein CcmI n=1 Tax=Tardiphaga sp. vice154 TaxID=2592814 RepID=UPI001165760A|nr:c-type cytochrome biogenesis protein CcmI [Tardiphaga sp. vice154]QDM21626.1 c-type cytochrome biogenesis protein CcmI [Tardiphaga sp. vice154]
MTLWFVFALMTAAAIFAVLWPLGRARSTAGGTEAAVYKDQLAEVGRDAEIGLIGPNEATAARVEISRRLLAADEAERAVPAKNRPIFRRAVALVALIGLPLIAVAFYGRLGSPDMPDVPLASRSQTPTVAQPLDNLVAQVQAHLEQNPTDGRGWNVLAPVLVKLGRFDEAVAAYRNAIAHAGDSPGRRADLGEAIAAAANGVITADAKAEFERAVAQDANEVKARYFLGLAAEQDGRNQDAAAIWGGMLAKAPADAPWRTTVQAALARVGGPALPALSSETMAAAQGMEAGDRNAMVLGMVDRLATRLKQDGSDVEGWLRLVRAYIVLGDRDKAKGALIEARQAVGTDAGKLQQLNDGLKSFGFDG